MNKTRTLTKGHLNGIHNLRQGLTKLPLLNGNMQKETGTEKNIIHDFMRFGDSSKELDSIIQSLCTVYSGDSKLGFVTNFVY